MMTMFMSSVAIKTASVVFVSTIHLYCNVNEPSLILNSDTCELMNFAMKEAKNLTDYSERLVGP